MSLDMYAYKAPRRSGRKAVDFLIDRIKGREQLYRWRNHHDLHDWMEALFLEKGGKRDFNGNAVELTAEDLDALEREIRESLVPETAGCFSSWPEGDTPEDDLEFIAHAREALKAGYAVFYTSSW